MMLNTFSMMIHAFRILPKLVFAMSSIIHDATLQMIPDAPILMIHCHYSWDSSFVLMIKKLVVVMI